MPTKGGAWKARKNGQNCPARPLPRCKRSAAIAVGEESAVINAQRAWQTLTKGRAPLTPIEWQEERGHHCMRGVWPQQCKRSADTAMREESAVINAQMAWLTYTHCGETAMDADFGC